jgi:hypothetical protein
LIYYTIFVGKNNFLYAFIFKEIVADDGVFTVKIGPASSKSNTAVQSSGGIASSVIPNPHPRINCSLLIKNSKLFLYGGIFEKGDRVFTLSDFYSLGMSSKINIY